MSLTKIFLNLTFLLCTLTSNNEIALKLSSSMVNKLFEFYLNDLIELLKNYKFDPISVSALANECVFDQIKISDLSFIERDIFILKDNKVCVKIKEANSFGSFNTHCSIFFKKYNKKIETQYKITLSNIQLCAAFKDDKDLILRLPEKKYDVKLLNIQIDLLANNFSENSNIKAKLSDIISYLIEKTVTKNIEELLNKAFTNLKKKHFHIINLNRLMNIVMNISPSEFPIFEDGLIYRSKCNFHTKKKENVEISILKQGSHIYPFTENKDFELHVNNIVLNDFLHVLFKTKAMNPILLDSFAKINPVKFNVASFSFFFTNLKYDYNPTSPVKIAFKSIASPDINITNQFISFFCWFEIKFIVVENNNEFTFSTATALVNANFVLNIKKNDVLEISILPNSSIHFDSIDYDKVNFDITQFDRIVNAGLSMWLKNSKNIFHFLSSTFHPYKFKDLNIQFSKNLLKVSGNIDLLSQELKFKDDKNVKINLKKIAN